ncbi:uncharacterized protein LOC143464530 [Clavelina lepadiformis]|uniref:uncharacterized protein LOC143464530 n=1 Tax=Clavelina lepadiformis TaxID=159417 RepID=UPI0040436BED
MKCQGHYPTWKSYLFRLQEEAPKPKLVVCQRGEVSNRPHFYGEEYHGLISRDAGERLCKDEGNFLIRESQNDPGRFTLVLRVLNMVKNFKLYYEDGKHFVGEKKFDSVYDLAQDGLITMYVESKAQDYIESMAREPVYNSLSRYSSISRTHDKRKQLTETRSGSQSPREETIERIPGSQSPRNCSSSNNPSPVHFTGLDKCGIARQNGVLHNNHAKIRPEQSAGLRDNNLKSHGDAFDEKQLFYEDCREHLPLCTPDKFPPSLDDQYLKLDGGKKKLTPTSSDERKRNKKRVAMDGSSSPHTDVEERTHVAPPGSESPDMSGKQYAVYKNDAYKPALLRRLSCDTAIRPVQRSPYHQVSVAQKHPTTVAHVRQIGGGYDRGKASMYNHMNGKLQDHKQPPYYEGIFEHQDQNNDLKASLSTVKEIGSTPGTALSHPKLKYGHFQDTRKLIHHRQRSEPIMDPFSRAYESDSQDFVHENYLHKEGSRVRLSKLPTKTQGIINRAGSTGSCESGLSNDSGGIEKSGSSNVSPHGSCHFSSEDDRSTPSPRHMTAFHRSTSETPNSSSRLFDARRRDLPQQQPGSPWKYQREDRLEESGSGSSSGGRNRKPLGIISSSNHDNNEAVNLTAQKKCDVAYEHEVRATLHKTYSSPSRVVSEQEQHLSCHDVRNDNKGRRLAQHSVKDDVASPEKERPNYNDIKINDKGRSSPHNQVDNRPRHSSSFKTKKSSVAKSSSCRHQGPSSPSNRHRDVTSSPKKGLNGKCMAALNYDKEHHFKSHTYRGLQWCEYCGNFMWGLIQQGVQCKDCGLNVHKQCAKLVPNDCQPALKHLKHVYGVDLTTLVKLHCTSRPVVIDKCVAEIEERGMQSEGIYRVPGSHDVIVALKADFDQYGCDTDLSHYDDINIVAGVLKLYLRELPVPLLPYHLYSRFINAAKISHNDIRLDAIRMAMSAMPGAHLESTKYLIQHLSRVCEHSGSNQMSPHSLGIVFGPTLLRPPEKDVHAQYNLNDTQHQQEVVATMIEFCRHLFGNG